VLRGGRRGWLVRRVLLGADVAGLTTAFLLAAELFRPSGTADAVDLDHELVLFVATLPLWAILFRANGLYDGDEESANHSTADDLIGVFHAVTIGTFMILLAGWLTDWFAPPMPRIFTFWTLAIVAITACRAVARALVRRSSAYVQRTLIVGAGDVGQRMAEKILRHPEYGIRLVGFVDGRPRERRPTLGDLTILGTVADLGKIVRAYRVDRVIIAFSNDDHELSLGAIRGLADTNVRVDVVPRFFEAHGTRVRMHALEGMPLTALPRLRLPRTSMLAKRCLDLVLAGALVVVLSPFLLVIAAAILADSGRPVLFRQRRVGAYGEPFWILKFRTMTTDADARKHEVAGLNKHARPGGDPRMFKIADDPRVTRVGKVLRRYSLDELPQLWNVLRGEMSLVGPRPLIPEEDASVHDWRRRRLYVRPGITGLWQVLGRDDIPFEEMAILDHRYVTSWSLLGDVQLMLRTLPAMVRSRSAY